MRLPRTISQTSAPTQSRTTTPSPPRHRRHTDNSGRAGHGHRPDVDSNPSSDSDPHTDPDSDSDSDSDHDRGPEPVARSFASESETDELSHLSPIRTTTSHESLDQVEVENLLSPTRGHTHSLSDDDSLDGHGHVLKRPRARTEKRREDPARSSDSSGGSDPIDGLPGAKRPRTRLSLSPHKVQKPGFNHDDHVRWSSDSHPPSSLDAQPLPILQRRRRKRGGPSRARRRVRDATALESESESSSASDTPSGFTDPPSVDQSLSEPPVSDTNPNLESESSPDRSETPRRKSSRIADSAVRTQDGPSTRLPLAPEASSLRRSQRRPPPALQQRRFLRNASWQSTDSSQNDQLESASSSRFRSDAGLDSSPSSPRSNSNASRHSHARQSILPHAKIARALHEVTSRKSARGQARRKAELLGSVARYKHLLGQTDIFTYFWGLRVQRDPEFAQLLESCADGKAGTVSASPGSRRHRVESKKDSGLGGSSTHEPMVYLDSPEYVQGSLRPYQLDGLNWLIQQYHNHLNGILADDMGLGKTLQTISFLGYLKHVLHISGFHLIVVPRSTLDNWARELRRWVPDLDTVVLTGTQEERRAILKKRVLNGKFEIVLTTYELAQREKTRLMRISWEVLVMDEAHRLKNTQSMAFRGMHGLDTRHRLLITGTPLQNNLKELWSLLHFLVPDVFAQADDFDLWIAGQSDPSAEEKAAGQQDQGTEVGGHERHTEREKALLDNKQAEGPKLLQPNEGHALSEVQTNGRTNSNHPSSGPGSEEVPKEPSDEPSAEQTAKEKKVVQQLHQVLRPFILRRVKGDVEKSLLPKQEINLFVGLTEMQRNWYRALLKRDVDAITSGAKKSRLMNIVMQLRKCCNHPYLFSGAEEEVANNPAWDGTDQHLIDNSAKMIVLDQLLKRFRAEGSRVLIFSQMSLMLDIISDYCDYRGYETSRIDGATPHEERVAAMDEFNAPNSSKFVFLLTTRAGGLGINLTSANIVILYDSDWNPQADQQAMDRAHRIGQTKQVNVYRLITEHSVEERMLSRSMQKLRLDQLIIQQGAARQESTATQRPSQTELAQAIQHGADHILRTPAAKPQQANGQEGPTEGTKSIDDIIAEGQRRTESMRARYAQAGFDVLTSLQKGSTIPQVPDQEDEKDREAVKSLVGVSAPNNTSPMKQPRRTHRRQINYAENVQGSPISSQSDKEEATDELARGTLMELEALVGHGVWYRLWPSRLVQLSTQYEAHKLHCARFQVPESRNLGPEETWDEMEASQSKLRKLVKLASALTLDEERERQALLRESIERIGPSWTYPEFEAYVLSLRTAGSQDVARHTHSVNAAGKSVAGPQEAIHADSTSSKNSRVDGRMKKGERKKDKGAGQDSGAWGPRKVGEVAAYGALLRERGPDLVPDWPSLRQAFQVGDEISSRLATEAKTLRLQEGVLVFVRANFAAHQLQPYTAWVNRELPSYSAEQDYWLLCYWATVGAHEPIEKVRELLYSGLRADPSLRWDITLRAKSPQELGARAAAVVAALARSRRNI